MKEHSIYCLGKPYVFHVLIITLKRNREVRRGLEKSYVIMKRTFSFPINLTSVHLCLLKAVQT